MLSLFLSAETSRERNLYIFTNMPASGTCDNSCLLGRYIVRNRILILSKRQMQNDFYCGYGCYEEDKLSQNSCCKLNKWIHTVSDLIGKHRVQTIWSMLRVFQNVLNIMYSVKQNVHMAKIFLFQRDPIWNRMTKRTNLNGIGHNGNFY